MPLKLIIVRRYFSSYLIYQECERDIFYRRQSKPKKYLFLSKIRLEYLQLIGFDDRGSHFVVRCKKKENEQKIIDKELFLKHKKINIKSEKKLRNWNQYLRSRS